MNSDKLLTQFSAFISILLLGAMVAFVALDPHDAYAKDVSVKKVKKKKFYKKKKSYKKSAKLRKTKAKTSVFHKSLDKKSNQKYFVEFRARPNGVTSHSFMAYGRLTSRGRLRNVRLIGLHPKDKMPDLIIAGLAGIEAQLKPVWGDKNIPHTVSFRVPIDYKQYKKVLKFIRTEKKKSHTWNLVLNNCNGFIGRIAEIIGLRSPLGAAVAPTAYVREMIELNS